MERIAVDAVNKASAAMDLSGDFGGTGLESLLGASAGRSSKRRYEMLRSWVFVCVRAISQRVSGQPICVGEMHGTRTPDQRAVTPVSTKAHPLTLREKAAMPSSVKASVTRSDGLEVYEQHAILDMMEHPNPAQDKHAFFFQTIINYYLTGVNYWLYGVDGEGNPELWAVPTHWIIPSHEDGLFSKVRSWKNVPYITNPLNGKNCQNSYATAK